MKNNDEVIEALNEFLKGQYMGIHAYDRLMEKVNDQKVMKMFQQFQQDHHSHAKKVAERIEQLGGTPVKSEGIIGEIQGYIGNLMISDSTIDILQSALKGEGYYGVEVSEEIVKGDLDFESKQMIEDILDKDRYHAELIRNILN